LAVKITFDPQHSPESQKPVISVFGDVLTIGGESLDFSPLGEGEAIMGEDVGHPMVKFFVPVRRVDGQVEVTLICPVSETKERVTVEVTDGDVEVPK
jgi:hypothetical protein